MRKILLAVVVICALVIAGIGGTLAGFSDTESSHLNVIEVSNLDLKVSVPYNGPEFDDPNVPPIVHAYQLWPCTSQDFTFDLHNNGENPNPAYVYVAFKNFLHYEVLSTKFPDGRPEPEVVAEEGGWLANQETPPMGPWGQNSTLFKFIEIYLEYDIDGDGDLDPILGNPLWGGPGTVYLSDLWDGTVDQVSTWIPLGTLAGSNDRDGKISVHISNWSEEQWDALASQLGTDPPMPGTTNVFTNNDLPFNDWLTNLFMSDGGTFEIIYALTQSAMPTELVYD